VTEPFTPRQVRRFVGSYRPRIDGLEKASGKALYADDATTRVRFPNLLHARVLRSPHPHARIRSIDLSAAAALPGVVDILTFADSEVARLRPTSAGWTDGVDTVSYERMMWRRFRDRRVLDDHVCWVGDEAGVVVAAESEAVAEEALRRIVVDWEVLPFVLDPLEAMRPGAPAVHPDIAPANVLPADEVGGPDVFVDKGDALAALAEAEVVVAGTSIYHNANQGALENWTCTAQWEGGTLTVWSNSYEADQTRMHLSQMLEIPLSHVRVISHYVGGQFGRNDTGDQPLFVFTALLARRTGRPVKFRHSRREAFHDSRQPVIYEGRAGAKRDGTITALSFKGIGNVGAYADHSVFALKFAPTEVAEVCFAHVPNVRMEAYGVYTNKLPGCMMRGVGNSQLNLILGHLVDLLAEQLGRDPLDLAVQNFGHRWEVLPDRSLAAVLQAGAHRIGWQEKRHAPGEGEELPGGRRRGVGFSFHPGWHAEWQELRRGEIQVSLRLNPDGTVLLDAPTVETGTGSNTCNVLGCAEALAFLGVTPEDITWVAVVDTERGLKDTVQTDSSVSFLQSEALVQAAAELKGEVLAVAARQWGVPVAEIDVAGGRIFRRGAEAEGVDFRTVLWQGDLVPLVVTTSRRPAGEETGVPYLAAFAEVEVDAGTGRVDVLELVVVNDCGTVMYASGAEAQQIGGQCAGIGETLTEEIVYDRGSGAPLNFNWIDYRIPTLPDMPPITPVLLEEWRGAGEYGACGIGEGVLTCTPRAILNAVYQAIGVRLDEIPLTPQKVLAALGKA
jgi:xanthine dehydrogenase molybdenum-binding subunit